METYLSFELTMKLNITESSENSKPLARINKSFFGSKRFCISKKLNSSLHKYDIKTQKELCLLENTIISFSRKTGSAGIHSKYLARKGGPRYRDNINILLNEIQSININESYLSQETIDEKRWVGKKSYTKKYSIPLDAMETCKVSFPKQRIEKPKKILPEVKDERFDWIAECIRKVGLVDNIFIPPSGLTHEKQVRIFDGLEDISLRKDNAKIGDKGGRLTHTIILMPEEGRHNLTVNGKPLTEGDIITCFPYLLSKFFEDKEEKAKYEAMLDKDIYSVMASDLNISRDKAKDKFNECICEKDVKTKQYYTAYEWFNKQFPIFVKTQLNIKTDFAATLQRMESDVMVIHMNKWTKERGIFYISMHDGWLCLNSKDRKLIEKEVGFQFKKLYGVTISFKHKKYSYSLYKYRKEEGRRRGIMFKPYEMMMFAETGFTTDWCWDLKLYLKEQRQRKLKRDYERRKWWAELKETEEVCRRDAELEFLEYKKLNK